MGGCTNCGGKSGCDHRKSTMLGAVQERLNDLYPTKKWPVIDDAQADGPTETEIVELAETLGEALKASTLYAPGGESDLCDYVYVLCQGREPSLLQVLLDEVPFDDAPVDGLYELHLRIAVSRVARLAIVQEVQVAWKADEQGDGRVDTVVSAGVYSAPLLKRFRKLVDMLPQFDLIHCDMGELCEPPEGFDGSAYEERYGRIPSPVNYLFYAAPPSMVAARYLERL